MKQLAKYGDQAYALLRIVAGFMFSFHGAQIILFHVSPHRVPRRSNVVPG